MEHTTAVIIGAGHAGLAMSRALTQRSIDHVILERGRAGHAWRTERWDSLRLLTPNWANGLPGDPYSRSDPDGYMSAKEFADDLERYARAIAAPLRECITVTRLTRRGLGYCVETDQGPISARKVVNATGATSLPKIPPLAGDLTSRIAQITLNRYRNPAELPPGDVLIVGASASGVQLARDIQLSGRQVILAVGTHVRLPRHYRGRDIEYWLDRSGVYDETADQIEDLPRARRLPSAQLVGGGIVDLNALQALGVEITGRLSAIRDGKALFSGGLSALTSAADLKMYRMLDRFDDWIAANVASGATAPEDRPDPTLIPDTPRLSLDLRSGSIRTVVWATGFRPNHSWMDVPIFDARGQLRHHNGACPSPGLFVLGLPVLRRRRSHHIAGADADTQHISSLIHQHLNASHAA